MLATLGAVAVLVAAFLVIRWATTPAPPAPASTVSVQQLTTELAGIPASTLDQVGMGSASTAGVKRISDAPLPGPNGRPEVLYVGGEFCPYCAAERWPLVIALSRFGTIGGLQTARSSANDVFPSTPTFTFRSVTYHSQVIDLVAVEHFGSSPAPGGGYETLQPLTPAQQALAQRYGGGSIPFVDFGNRAALSGATYSPAVLQGSGWEQVVQALGNPSSDQARAILGSANVLTAAICQATGQQPAEVCGSAGVRAAAAHLA